VKGISNLELKIASTKTIEKIVWRSDDTFQHNMADFLLNGNDPFDGATNFQPGITYIFPPPPIFDNRRLFPVNEVFKDPIHLEITYANQADAVHMTIPTHLSHLLQTGQTLADDAGNNVFEISRVEKKAQYRASVYAAFNDNTIGDLTNNHGLTWDRGPGVNAGDITFESDGTFVVAQSAVGKTLPIKATLPASLSRPGLTEATGNVRVLDSWLNATPIATRVTGSPTNLDPANVPNVLFIAEGFTSQTEFERAVISLHSTLRTSDKTMPWKQLFTNSMNAWMLFESSRETAVTILYENVLFDNLALADGTQAHVALPLNDLRVRGNAAVSDTTGLNVADLISQVGLPLPADANANSAQKLTEWQQLFDPNFGNNVGGNDLRFSPDEFNFWRRLSGRKLVEERDTAWGLRCGEKEKVVPDIASNKITFNDEARVQRCNLDLFFSRVRANNATGSLIGESLWGRDPKGKFGKDYGLVVFLVGGAMSIGTRFAEPHFPQGDVNTGIGAGLVDDHVPLSSVAPKLTQSLTFFLWKPAQNIPSFEIDPFPVLADISIGATATVAHELCHSFNLDDEYSVHGRGSIPAGISLKGIYNLQARSDLLVGSQLSGDNVKWRWPRIKKAGVLEIAPTQGPPITVTLRAGHVQQFAADETVCLRQKDLLGTPHADLSSPPLKILSKNDTNRTITMELVDPATVLNVANFGPASLLYVPVKPSGNGNNPTNDTFAEVLSPLLRHQINQTHNPQTHEPCVDEIEGAMDQKVVNLPSDLEKPAEHRRVVGLFSGGKEFACDVYHASGECIMRGITFEEIVRTTGVRQRQTYQFCQVCRYSLVDQIDPLQHLHVDKAYDPEYPLKEKGTPLWLKIVIAIFLAGLAGWGLYELLKKKDENKPPQ
jgi:hypothetical protein